MTALLQDIRFAFRAFARNPGFAAAAVLSLAIGIGANTSIYSVVSALLLHSLPYRDAARLVILWNRSPGLGITEDWFSTAQYFDIRGTARSFDDVAIAIGGIENLSGDGEPERIGTVRASSNLLGMLGARAYRGRLFLPREDSPGAPATVVLSYSTWLRRYGGDQRVLGRTIVLNGRPYEVAGVLPRSFSLPREVLPILGGAEMPEVFVSLSLGADAADVRGHEDYNILARLRAGVTLQQAQAEMDALTARLRRDHPDVYPPNGGLTFGVVPLLEQVVGDVRAALLTLTGAVGLVLLIACANVSNLFLSRALARDKELAVRAALGAGRGRIVRQLLTESALLALGGGLLGVLLAFGMVRFIHALGAGSVPRLAELGINVEVLFFTLFLSLAAGILFGFAPALRVSRINLQDALKESGHGAAAASAVWSRRNYFRRALVAAELALSVVLLTGAGLLLRSFVRLQNVSPGFNPDHVLTFSLSMSGRKYTGRQAVIEAYRRLWDRLDHLPGVTASGGAYALPLSQLFAWGPITVEGRAPAPGEKFLNADERMVAGRFFEAMQIPLLEGRLFSERDAADKPRVALVDEFMARELWPGQSPVGKRIHSGGIGENSPWITVVGVVGRVKQYTLDADSRIAFYLPHEQSPARELTVVVRSVSDPAALAAAVRNEIRALDPDLPMYYVRTMNERVAESLARRRFSLLLLEIFAGFALGLAAVGVYGVMSYLVTQGARELGIRVALGATQRAVLSLVLGRGMLLAAGGIALGAGAALAMGRLIARMLFRVGPADPLTFSLVTGIMLGVAFLAVSVPARRATRVDPIVALREE
ncbi:MAG TPA: ABC transporter permease [Methylomirabilota bacterium]|nr:ABC transporter permease [Methylomirabilota bacterium]